MGRKGKHTSISINQSIFDIGGLLSVPLGFVFFLRLRCCYKPTLSFFHTIIWAKVFACCRVLPLPTRNTENGEAGQVLFAMSTDSTPQT